MSVYNDDEEFPCPLNEYLRPYGYRYPEKEVLLKNTEKYTLMKVLDPVLSWPDDDVDDDFRMLQLYNNEDGKYYIGKWFRQALSEPRDEINAHKLLDPLNCPHIIRIVQTLEPYIGRCGLLITPQYQTFDIGVLKQYPKQVTHQLLTALKVVHENNMVHWDVCTDNIVWEWDSSVPHLYLIDFDSAYKMTQRLSRLRLRFSYGYAPLGDKGLFEDGIRGYPADDMWGVGVIFFELLIGETQTFGNSRSSVGKVIRKALSSIAECDPLAVDLATKLLTKRPKDRLTASEALKHPYFDNEPAANRKKSKKRKRNDSGSDTEGTKNIVID